uniref:Rpr2-domain-containing protein n=1 Tax=Rhabditophanes sp. KR3021 TaxID=114890 RepID=A0AC35U9D1_9BILA
MKRNAAFTSNVSNSEALLIAAQDSTDKKTINFLRNLSSKSSLPPILRSQLSFNANKISYDLFRTNKFAAKKVQCQNCYVVLSENLIGLRVVKKRKTKDVEAICKGCKQIIKLASLPQFQRKVLIDTIVKLTLTKGGQIADSKEQSTSKIVQKSETMDNKSLLKNEATNKKEVRPIVPIDTRGIANGKTKKNVSKLQLMMQKQQAEQSSSGLSSFFDSFGKS